MKSLAVLGAASVALGLIVGVAERAKKRNRKAEKEKENRQEEENGHRCYGVYEKYFKRPFDFALAFFALVVLSPVLAAVAFLVKAKLGSPVIFTQERPG